MTWDDLRRQPACREQQNAVHRHVNRDGPATWLMFRRAIELDSNGEREILERVRDLHPEDRSWVARHGRVPHEEREPRDQRARGRTYAGAPTEPDESNRTEHECDHGARADEEIERTHRVGVTKLRNEAPRAGPDKQDSQAGGE